MQARASALLLTFLDAYNSGDLATASSLFAEDVLISDCDYLTRKEITANGTAAASAWLRARIADHDRLVLRDLYFGSPNSEGSFAVAVSFERRTSDTLRSVGFESGIQPPLATKAGVSKTGDRLLGWVSGSPASCTPTL